MCGNNVSNKQVVDEKTLYNGHLAHNVPWRERPTCNTYSIPEHTVSQCQPSEDTITLTIISLYWSDLSYWKWSLLIICLFCWHHYRKQLNLGVFSCHWSSISYRVWLQTLYFLTVCHINNLLICFPRGTYYFTALKFANRLNLSFLKLSSKSL